MQTFYHKFCNYGFSPSSPSIDSFVFQFPWYITSYDYIITFVIPWYIGKYFSQIFVIMVFHLLAFNWLFYFSSLDILRANILSQIFVIMVFHLLRLQLTLLYFSSLDILRHFITNFCKYFITNFCNYGFSPSSPSIDSFVFQFPWYITCKHFITNFCNYGFSPSSPSIDSFVF